MHPDKLSSAGGNFDAWREAGAASGPEHTALYVRTRTRPGDKARREINLAAHPYPCVFS